MADDEDRGELDDRTITRSTEEARQGVTGHNVRRVLGWGIAGALLAIAVLALA